MKHSIIRFLCMFLICIHVHASFILVTGETVVADKESILENVTDMSELSDDTISELARNSSKSNQNKTESKETESIKPDDLNLNSNTDSTGDSTPHSINESTNQANKLENKNENSSSSSSSSSSVDASTSASTSSTSEAEKTEEKKETIIETTPEEDTSSTQAKVEFESTFTIPTPTTTSGNNNIININEAPSNLDIESSGVPPELDSKNKKPNEDAFSTESVLKTVEETINTNTINSTNNTNDPANTEETNRKKDEILASHNEKETEANDESKILKEKEKIEEGNKEEVAAAENIHHNVVNGTTNVSPEVEAKIETNLERDAEFPIDDHNSLNNDQNEEKNYAQLHTQSEEDNSKSILDSTGSMLTKTEEETNADAAVTASSSTDNQAIENQAKEEILSEKISTDLGDQTDKEENQNLLDRKQELQAQMNENLASKPEEIIEATTEASITEEKPTDDNSAESFHYLNDIVNETNQKSNHDIQNDYHLRHPLNNDHSITNTANQTDDASQTSFNTTIVESLEKETIMEQLLTKPNESIINSNTKSMSTNSNTEYTTAQSYHHQVKYCADFKPIKDLFNQHIEQFYKPVISLLPEDFQLILLDETHIAGLNTAACLLIIFSLAVLLSVWYIYLKRKQREQHMQTVRLNEKMLIVENSLKKMTFEKQTFESEYTDLEMKYADVQTRFNEREDKLKQASDMCTQLTHTNSSNQKEIEKLKSNEAKLNKEMTMLKIELANSKQQTQNEMEEHEMRMNNLNVDHQAKVNELSTQLAQSQNELESKTQLVNQLEQQVFYFKENETKLNETLESKEKMIQMLQNSLLQLSKKDIIEINTEITDEPLVVVNNSNTQPQTFDGLIKIAELQMEIKNLEDQLNAERTKLQLKSGELADLEERLDERQTLITRLEHRQKELEKANKDQEMQIRLLNELREKDTKQHLKALSELDSQLKKKSNDADKISHFLEQLRVKQERIQELETQLARVERQANQERQQSDKQMHENWLQSRKIEKELKESKLELNSLKEKCAELEILNKNLNENNNLMRQTLPGKQAAMAAASHTAASAHSNAFFMSPNDYAYQQHQLSRHSIDSSSSLSNTKEKQATGPDDQTNTLDTEATVAGTNDQQTTNDLNKQIDQPLQLETLIDNNRQASSSSPSTSSTSGHHHLNYQQGTAAVAAMHANMYMNPYMIRPPGAPVPFRYPFPLPTPAAYMQHQQQQQQMLNDSAADPSSSTSSTPSRPMIPPVGYPPAAAYQYRMNPMIYQQQQYLQQQYQQFQQSKSASSSQMPSPNTSASMPYSQTYPGYLNDSASTTKDNQSQNQLEEAVNEACQENLPSATVTDINQSSTASDSNFNV